MNPPLRIVDAIFRDPTRPLSAHPRAKRWLRNVLYVAVALGLHVGAVFSLWMVPAPEHSAPNLSKSLPASIAVSIAPAPSPIPPLPPPEPEQKPAASPTPKTETIQPPAALASPPPQTPSPAPPQTPTIPPKPSTEKPKSPAKAGRIITAPPTAAPLDFSDPGFVSGDADQYAGGVTSPNGTSDTAVPIGTPSPSPTSPPPIPPPTPPDPPTPPPKKNQPKHAHDLSRPVALEGGRWDCPWPAEADREQIDSQLVVIRVTVAPDGAPLSARVTRDPGFGFGPAAQACAMRRHYAPALDPSGTPITSESPPIRVHFSRW